MPAPKLATKAYPDHLRSPFQSHGRAFLACPGHPSIARQTCSAKAWMPATSAGMTGEFRFNSIGTCSSLPVTSNLSTGGRFELEHVFAPQRSATQRP